MTIFSKPTPKPASQNMTRFMVMMTWGLAVLIALGSWRFLVAELEVVMPHMLHHALDRPLWLYTHIGFAPVALLLLPFQFHKRLRQSRPGLHRWLGRLYGVSILLSGIAGVSLGLTTAEGAVAGAGLVALALAWLVTTAMAIYLAIQRQIAAHRIWMIRSAALTLSAVTLRLYLPIGGATVGMEVAYPVICWICWVPNLILAEWLIQHHWAKPSASVVR